MTLETLAVLSGMTKRAVQKWHQDGLLPSPKREAVGGERGRASYRFPSSTVSVVRALAAFRRYARSSEDAKVWLWLQGFDHLGLTESTIETRLRQWHSVLWQSAEVEWPFIGRLQGMALHDETKDDILDALDRFVRQPLQERLTTVDAEAGTSMTAMILGVADEADVDEWFHLLQEDIPNAREYVGFVQASCCLIGQIFGGPEAQTLDLSEAEDRYVITQLAVLLPRIRFLPERLDWARVRFAWALLCRDTDAWLDSPEAAPNPWTIFACQWRRLCYRYPPEFALLALSAIASNPFWEALGISLPHDATRMLADVNSDADTAKSLSLSHA